MRKCIKCECLFQDYEEKCPCCGADLKYSKKWEISNSKKTITSEKKIEIEQEEDIYKDIVDNF
jgi:transcription initiation factor IIE alpha subunit